VPLRFDVVGVGENSVDHVYRLTGSIAPDSKVRAFTYQVSCGGQVATTLAACTAFRLRTAYVGAIGNDDNGARIREELAVAGVDTALAVVRDAPNRHAVILVDECTGARTVVWHREAALALGAGDVPDALVARTRLVHVDDVDEEASIAAAQMAVRNGIPVTSDIDRVTDRTLELMALSTVPILSTHVPSGLTGEDDPERALRKLRMRHEGWLCVTLGADGAMLLDGDRLHHTPALAIDAVDTTGAGDVFRAGFIYALLHGQGPFRILQFAAAAAALSCTRQGAIASVPALEEVERALDAEP
jgi:sulfofructose kinase